jgi:hypothetical protein
MLLGRRSGFFEESRDLGVLRTAGNTLRYNVLEEPIMDELLGRMENARCGRTYHHVKVILRFHMICIYDRIKRLCTILIEGT